MEADSRYFWRRAVEELAAARRSLTPQARERHLHFVELYLRRLQRMGAPLPFGLDEIPGQASAPAEAAAA